MPLHESVHHVCHHIGENVNPARKSRLENALKRVKSEDDDYETQPKAKKLAKGADKIMSSLSKRLHQNHLQDSDEERPKKRAVAEDDLYHVSPETMDGIFESLNYVEGLFLVQVEGTQHALQSFLRRLMMAISARTTLRELMPDTFKNVTVAQLRRVHLAALFDVEPLQTMLTQMKLVLPLQDVVFHISNAIYCLHHGHNMLQQGLEALELPQGLDRMLEMILKPTPQNLKLISQFPATFKDAAMSAQREALLHDASYVSVFSEAARKGHGVSNTMFLDLADALTAYFTLYGDSMDVSKQRRHMLKSILPNTPCNDMLQMHLALHPQSEYEATDCDIMLQNLFEKQITRAARASFAASHCMTILHGIQLFLFGAHMEEQRILLLHAIAMCWESFQQLPSAVLSILQGICRSIRLSSSMREMLNKYESTVVLQWYDEFVRKGRLEFQIQPSVVQSLDNTRLRQNLHEMMEI